MSESKRTTWEVLSKTSNRAVVRLWSCALRIVDQRAAAIRAIVRRRDSASHSALIRHFTTLCAEDQAIVREAHCRMPHHMAATLRAAVMDGESELCLPACQIIVLCQDFDLFSALVQAAQFPRHRQATTVSAAILELARSLRQQLVDRSGAEETQGRDPAFVRRHVLVALERALADNAVGRRPELLEAFVLLAPSGDRALLKMLQEVRHRCHWALCELLASSADSGIVEQLLGMLHDTDAPAAALDAVARRTDPAFIERLLGHVKHPVPLRALHNMKRLRRVAWLETHRESLLEFDGRAQAVAIELALASSIDRQSLFDLLALVLVRGLAEGRRTSCAALARFSTPEADRLVRQALDDPDAGVQAAAVRQLRCRRFPDALELLVSLLDSAAAEVRDAARLALAEFNFVRYRAMFDLLDDAAAKSTGALVHKVDYAARAGLLEDLASPSASTRVRAIEMAVAMQAADDVREQLLVLAASENPALRQVAVQALGGCSGPEVIDRLRSAQKDSHETVRDAAAHSLERLAADVHSFAGSHDG